MTRGKQSYLVVEESGVRRWVAGGRGESESITLGRAIRKYYWPTRYEDIAKHCRSCHRCQLIGLNVPKEKPLSVAIMEPMQMFAINYLGPFTPTSVNGFKYILVGMDYMSRYLIATPTKEAKAHVSWQFMVDQVSMNFGWPDEVFSDNGSHFTAHEFTDRLKQVNVKHRPAPIKAP